MRSLLSFIMDNIKVIIIFIIPSFFLILYLGITIENSDFGNILELLAQICFTISIGLGTLAIAIKVSENTKVRFLNEILLVIMIGIVSFFLSFTPFMLLKRLYFMMSGFALVSIILSISSHTSFKENRRRRKTQKRK